MLPLRPCFPFIFLRLPKNNFSKSQVVWLQHDALLHQLLHDGGLLRGGHVQHAQPGPGPAQCEVKMFLPVLQTLK